MLRHTVVLDNAKSGHLSPIAAAVFGLLLAGCVSESEARTERAGPLAQLAVQQELSSRTKDPASVQWLNVRSRQVGDAWIVCGEFNARNSFGAYVGYLQFAGKAGDVLTERSIGTPLEARYRGYLSACG